ncbi:MAG: addiction module protein [Opitutales bacterium]|nr:addiction module protein [Opitutales bacterium]
MESGATRLGEAADAVYGVAAKLPVEERVFLAERLLASVESADFERLWLDEAVCRREEIRSGRAKAIPAEAVFKNVARRLGR